MGGGYSFRDKKGEFLAQIWFVTEQFSYRLSKPPDTDRSMMQSPKYLGSRVEIFLFR